MNKYDVMTLNELLRLYECCGMTVEVNNGHVTGLSFEEEV